MRDRADRHDGDASPDAFAADGAAGAVTGPARELSALLRDDTRARVLDAGVEVLRTVGHGQFSVQKVARAAGVYQGNVTYYWPRRRDLVLALAVRIVEDYLRTFEERFTTLDMTRSGWAEDVVCWLVDDAVSSSRVRLLPELWSMANADIEVAREVRRAFTVVVDTIVARLGLDPAGPDGLVMRRALELTGTAVQGLTAIYGHRSPEDRQMDDLRADLCALHAPLLVAAMERIVALGSD